MRCIQLTLIKRWACFPVLPPSTLGSFSKFFQASLNTAPAIQRSMISLSGSRFVLESIEMILLRDRVVESVLEVICRSIFRHSTEFHYQIPTAFIWDRSRFSSSGLFEKVQNGDTKTILCLNYKVKTIRKRSLGMLKLAVQATSDLIQWTEFLKKLADIHFIHSAHFIFSKPGMLINLWSKKRPSCTGFQ